ncbi:SLAF1 protein, partial [Scytalopus superciliaris]|nr:SLAF1 protein [Scytalopus superciliaris]
PQKKQVLVKYSGGNSTNYFPGQMSFQESNFSLEILNTSRQDGQLYEYSVSKGPEEEVQQLQLKVYEPVSAPSIRVLSKELTNGSCTVTLNCTSELGDHVSYSWAGGSCSGNSSFLKLSWHVWNTSTTCFCTATNPVSTGAVPFDPIECGHEPGGSHSPLCL